MIQIIAQVTRLEDRPRLFGAFGAVFGLSSIIGPLIGGSLTDHASLSFYFLFLIFSHLANDRSLGWGLPYYFSRVHRPITLLFSILALVFLHQPPYWRSLTSRCDPPTQIVSSLGRRPHATLATRTPAAGAVARLRWSYIGRGCSDMSCARAAVGREHKAME